MSSPSQPSGSPSNGYSPVSASSANSAAPTTSVGSSTGNVERILDANLLGHLAADQHRVGAAAEVLQNAELVLDLRAAGDQHERMLDLAEELREVLELGLEQQSGVRGSSRATPSVEACARWAEPNASFT